MPVCPRLCPIVLPARSAGLSYLEQAYVQLRDQHRLVLVLLQRFLQLRHAEPIREILQSMAD